MTTKRLYLLSLAVILSATQTFADNSTPFHVGAASKVINIGILGGGYSGQPIYWTRLEPNAGYRIVESAGSMLNSLWRTSTPKEPSQ